MKTYQKFLDKRLDELSEYQSNIRTFFQDKYKEINIDLSPVQLRRFENIFYDEPKLNKNITITDKQLEKSTLNNKNEIICFTSNIIEEFKINIEENLKNITDKMPNLIEDFSDNVSAQILKNLNDDFPDMLPIWEDQELNFQENVGEAWKDANNHLIFLIEIISEFLENYILEDNEIADREKHEVLLRLNAKGIQIAKEIIILLKNGFADGADARWRSLHEIDVVASLIFNNTNELSIRYLDHIKIETLKSTEQFNKYCERLNQEPINESIISKMKEDQIKLLEKHGKGFKNDYGWACNALNNKDPKLSDIEKAVELDHYRPYYKNACLNVHPNPKGLFVRMGISDNETILAGPSYIGIQEPGMRTAESISRIFNSLFVSIENIDEVIMMKTVANIAESTINSFIEAFEQQKLSTKNVDF